MDTWHIDTDALGPLRLRVAPTVVATRDGEVIPDPRTKQPIYMGELIVPGVSPGRRGPTFPKGIRVRFLGEAPKGLEDGQIVRLGGKVTVSAWYRPSARRGDNPASEITISPEAMQPTTEPEKEGVLRRLLPLRSPSPGMLPWTLLDVYEPEGADGLVAMVMTPVDTYGNDGTVEGALNGAPDIGLIGRQVQLVDVRGRIVFPDQRDVGRNLKSELVVTVGSIVEHRDLVTVSNGAKPAKAEPAPDQQ